MTLTRKGKARGVWERVAIWTIFRNARVRRMSGLKMLEGNQDVMAQERPSFTLTLPSPGPAAIRPISSKSHEFLSRGAFEGDSHAIHVACIHWFTRHYIIIHSGSKSISTNEQELAKIDVSVLGE